jgi:nitroreductase
MSRTIHPLVSKRRSSRAFSSKPVEPETLELLLEAARWAPSSMNEQPWGFIVATHRNEADFARMVACLVDFNQQWAHHAPVLLLSVARLNHASNGKPNRHALHDVGQAIANLTFQATELGLIVHQMAGFDVEKARDNFSLPSDCEPVAVAAIGYPGDPASLSEKLRERELAPPKRNPLESFVFEGRWDHPAAWLRKQD